MCEECARLRQQVTTLQEDATRRVEERRRNYIYVGDFTEDGKEVFRRRAAKFRNGMVDHVNDPPFCADNFTYEELVKMAADENRDKGHYLELIEIKFERQKAGGE